MANPVIRRIALGGCIGLLAAGAAAEQAGEDNAELTRTIAGLIAAHNAALPISFVPEPISSAAAEAVTYGTMTEGPQLDMRVMFDDVYEEVPDNLKRQRKQLMELRGIKS